MTRFDYNDEGHGGRIPYVGDVKLWRDGSDSNWLTKRGLVDTGATCILVSTDIAKELNLRETGRVFTIHPVGDPMHGVPEVILDIELPELSRATFYALCYGTEDEIILGTPLLDHFKLVFNGNDFEITGN